MAGRLQMGPRYAQLWQDGTVYLGHDHNSDEMHLHWDDAHALADWIHENVPKDTE